MSPHETAWRHGYAFSRDEGGAPKPQDPSLAQAWQRGFDTAEEEKERERNHIPTREERNEHAANEAALFQE